MGSADICKPVARDFLRWRSAEGGAQCTIGEYRSTGVLGCPE
jgi:hypothetical protein